MFDYTDAMDASRREYLRELADEFGIDPAIVFALADALGPSEDHDGLIAELEDIECFGFGS